MLMMFMGFILVFLAEGGWFIGDGKQNVFVSKTHVRTGQGVRGSPYLAQRRPGKVGNLTCCKVLKDHYGPYDNHNVCFMFLFLFMTAI